MGLIVNHKLKNGKLVPGKPLDIESLRVEYTDLGFAAVSTVLLPMDHNLHFDEDKMPKIFETMIFGGEHDQFQARYPTYNEALKHHNLIVESLKENKPLPKIEISPNWLEDYLRMFDV